MLERISYEGNSIMEDLLNIAICEDDEEEERKLLAFLEKSTILNQCTVFHSGEELLEVYSPYTYDLLLMDIYMKGINGIETVKQIRTIDEDIPVAFVTTSTDFTLESYRLSALKYIEKPYTEKAVHDILQLACMEKENAPSITINKKGKETKIYLSSILYVEIKARKLHIYLKNGEVIEVYDKLKAIEEQVDSTLFFSPHKSYLVNLLYVQYIDVELKAFSMKNGDLVPIRRESMGKAKKAFEDYLFNKTRRSFNDSHK